MGNKEMPNLMKTWLVGCIGLGMSITANAAPVTPTLEWEDVVDPVDIYMDYGDSYSFQHDITDNGFIVGTHVAESFTLTLNVYDDANSAQDIGWCSAGCDKNEAIKIDLPGHSADNLWAEISFDDIVTGFSLSGIVQLTSSGLLDVTIFQRQGDFYFGSSTLTVVGRVPEPSAVLLLGAGLVGLGFAARKRKASQQAQTC